MTLEELAENMLLCEYCPLPDELKGVKGTPNGYTACEGCRCNDAYEAYKEDSEVCIRCGELVHTDEAEYVQKVADDEYGPLCKKCYEKYKEGV